MIIKKLRVVVIGKKGEANEKMKNTSLSKRERKSLLKKLRERELEILIGFDELCNKYDIKYSLFFGTLLGAVRHRGFIPWDDDIDIMMTRNEYNKFLKISHELLQNLFFQNNKTDCFKFDIFMAAKIRDNNSKVEFGEKYRSGAFIDLFVIDKISKNMLIGTLQKYLYLLTRFVQYKEINPSFNIFKIIKMGSILEYIFLKTGKIFGNIFYIYWIKKELLVHDSDIFPTKSASFERKKFLMVNNPKLFLKGIYGDFMKLPPASERVGDHVDLDKIEIF